MATKAAPAVKSSKLSKPSKRSWSLGPWRMRSKMVVILFLVSQVPLLAVSAFTIVTARRALLDQASINMLSVSTEVGREVDNQLLGWRENIVAMGQMPEIIAYAGLSRRPLFAPSVGNCRPGAQTHTRECGYGFRAPSASLRAPE